MRNHIALASLLIAALAATPALASMGGGPRDEPKPPTEVEPGQEKTTARQEAERYYSDAYNEVAKANKDLADGKKKNSDKRFKKALGRGERAVEMDSTYFEAWNLVGYCARNLGGYDKSLAAYQRCLSFKPDYAAAREYLGELYVEMGNMKLAKEQLSWLERASASDAAKSLTARIESWSAAHPDSSSAAPTQAPADSTAAPASKGTSP